MSNFEAVIRLLEEGNPKRDGMYARRRYACYRDGMTITDYIMSGGSREALDWDVEQGIIRLEPIRSSDTY
jgi:hypothetical protein